MWRWGAWVVWIHVGSNNSKIGAVWAVWHARACQWVCGARACDLSPGRAPF